MPDHVGRSNAPKSKLCPRGEHVFAIQKAVMGLFIRSIGIKPAAARITPLNLAYTMHRVLFHEQR